MDVSFSNKLINLDPKEIIKKEKDNSMDNFFLILGLVYNDLKSLGFYTKILTDYFTDKIPKKDIENNIPSCNLGEFNGMKTHLERLITSCIHEFLIALQGNNTLLNTPQFKTLLEKTDKDTKEIWKQLIDLACGTNLTKKGEEFKKILKNIRNQGTFHYAGMGPKMKQGYTDYFYDFPIKNDLNKYAYFSDGQTMEKIRYFYCDAAMQFALKKDIEDSIKNTEEYYESLLIIMRQINFSISKLLNKYLENKK